MPQPYEVVLAYDGDDLEYFKRMNEVYEFDEYVTNHGGKNRWQVINEALDKSHGDYFIHLENDFYWSKPGCIEDALHAFDNFNVDFVRFERIPFQPQHFEEFNTLINQAMGKLKRRTPFAFNLNPHMRREKFPIGRFPEVYQNGVHPEGFIAMRWKGTSACLMGENFRHIGIYDESGHYKPFYAARFTLRDHIIKIDDPMWEFKRFCDNPEYIELFRKYLDDNSN